MLLRKNLYDKRLLSNTLMIFRNITKPSDEISKWSQAPECQSYWVLLALQRPFRLLLLRCCCCCCCICQLQTSYREADAVDDTAAGAQWPPMLLPPGAFCTRGRTCHSTLIRQSPAIHVNVSLPEAAWACVQVLTLNNGTVSIRKSTLCVEAQRNSDVVHTCSRVCSRNFSAHATTAKFYNSISSARQLTGDTSYATSNKFVTRRK